jgi:GDPmannose 4,6-dehydratase
VIATGEQHSVREFLLGDPSKAKQQLGWTPKISFMELVKEMVAADMQDAERDTLIEKEGFRAFNYYE